MKKKHYILSVVVILVILGGYKLITFMSAFIGDIYMHSERYEIRTSSQGLTKSINSFKDNNTDYKLITINENGEEIAFQDYYSDKYYHVFFYFKDANLTIQCLLSPIDNNSSCLSLYAVSTGVNFASWELINTKDLSKEDNRNIKKKFESEILDKLGKWERD
jgi:hypothetical protein